MRPNQSNSMSQKLTFFQKMRRVSASAVVLAAFVFLYVLCIGAYTFISSLNGINYFEEAKYPVAGRIRRQAPAKDVWTGQITLKACCDVDEYLDTNFNCVKEYNNSTEDFTLAKAKLLSETAVLDVDLLPSFIDQKRVTIQYGSKGDCPTDETTVTAWSKQQPFSYYIEQRTGNLLELSIDRKLVVSNYSTNSFCLDSMKDQEKFYAALICPCKEKICIHKCCPKGFYYNTETSSCVMEKLNSYKPNLGEGVPYHLVYSTPNCTGPDRVIVDENSTSPVNVTVNGKLMVPGETEGLDRKMYCVDLFSPDGGDNQSYVNGFYCPAETKDKARIVQRVMQVGYSYGGKPVAMGYFVALFCYLCFIM